MAREGVPLLVATVLAALLIWRYGDVAWLPLPAALFAWLFLVFRDPERTVPPAPLGVVSPVDGSVIDVQTSEKGALGRPVHRVMIKVDGLGTYTARCPAEGKVMDFRGQANDAAAGDPSTGLWIRTDEGDDVVLQFRDYRFGLAPRAFTGFGERVGQGQRCAYLRFTRIAEVQFALNGRVEVNEGQAVLAGSDLIGRLPRP